MLAFKETSRFYATGLQHGLLDGYTVSAKNMRRSAKMAATAQYIPAAYVEAGIVVDLVAIKKDIKAFFEAHHGERIDYVDIINAFDVPLPDVVQACNELVNEGKIAEID